MTRPKKPKVTIYGLNIHGHLYRQEAVLVCAGGPNAWQPITCRMVLLRSFSSSSHLKNPGCTVSWATGVVVIS